MLYPARQGHGNLTVGLLLLQLHRHRDYTSLLSASVSFVLKNWLVIISSMLLRILLIGQNYDDTGARSAKDRDRQMKDYWRGLDCWNGTRRTT